MFADSNRFVTRTYTVAGEKIRTQKTIVFVSDLHDKAFGEDNALLIDAVRRQNPDWIFVGGDSIVFLEAKKKRLADTSWMENACTLVKGLSAVAPVYLADGNHENNLLRREDLRPCYEELIRRMTEDGAVHLSNACITLPGAEEIRLCGLSLTHAMYRKVFRYSLQAEEIRGMLKEADPEHFTILLAHHPGYFPAYAAYGADLVLSGHFHGGLVRFGGRGLIGADLHLFPKYSGGCYRLGKSTMIVSCGLGSHTLPVRVNNPGELTVVRLMGNTHGTGI